MIEKKVRIVSVSMCRCIGAIHFTFFVNAILFLITWFNKFDTAIFATNMKPANTYFSFRHIASSALMLMILAWLTVCLPYVNQSQQVAKKQIEKTSSQSEDSNSPTNNSEEKTESGVSLLSEYLHEVAVMEHNFVTLSTFYKCHPSDLYLAYHPELVIPPPEA